MFISRQKWHFFFVDNIIKVLFSGLYLKLACKQYFFRHGKGIRRGKKYCWDKSVLSF